MTNIQLIHTHLPQELWELASTFAIPDTFVQSMPDLIILVLQSKSMDNKEEKQSRFSLLAMMNDEQIAKLRDILTREKQKLEEIETKYEHKKDAISNKMVNQRENTLYHQKMSEIKQEEANVQKQEASEAEHLLTQI